MLRTALLAVALTLELVSAVLWDTLEPRLVAELLALGACMLVGFALLVRCCCCCADPLDPLAARWALLIALLLVIEFAGALAVSRELFAASLLLVPAFVAPLAAIVSPRRAAVHIPIALATTLAAAWGTGAPAELAGGLTYQPAHLRFALCEYLLNVRPRSGLPDLPWYAYTLFVDNK
ncbi:hypothetical protein T492DRAFT_310027 [Pavlovales sp. CCMP2436]|nr:hypothetical protein T492DRAFT_310027 [Pavlovales sp. CCMP2436]